MNNDRNTQFLKVKKESANKLLNLIKSRYRDNQIINKRKKIIQIEDYILFPLIKSGEEINKLVENETIDFVCEIVNTKAEFDPNYKFRTIEEALATELPENIINLIPKSYDIIGNIAIIEFDRFTSLHQDKASSYKKAVAEAIIKVNKKVETVYEKTSEVKGKFRLKELQLLVGNDNPETTHKENNCTFKLNVKNMYFTPRLVFERKRLSLLNFTKNEVIVDMFAGVGPISIQIAKTNEVQIYSFDINPMAYRYIVENVNLNKLRGNVLTYNMDVAELMKSSNELGNILKENVDRVIMNLPEQSMNYLDTACFLTKKSGGLLHFYQFCEKPNSIENGIEKLSSILNKLGWRLEEILNSKIVKPFSPKSDLIVVDAKIKCSQ
ncbi:MAG: class I SAM-dependent methyltransferase family protein [Candidatus Hermodarchaeota archaeon]